MIQIENFGWRLGNQLFQLATAIALGEKNGDETWFPRDWAYAKMFEGDFSAPATGRQGGGMYKKHNEQGFHYTEIPPSTHIINGYGPTEGTTFTCCYRIPVTLASSARGVPIGRPIANRTKKAYIPRL